MLTRFLLVLAIVFSAPAGARELTAGERQDLVTAIETFGRAYQARDAAALVAAMPARVVAEIANGDADDTARRSTVAAAVAKRLAREMTIDLKIVPEKTSFHATPDGMPFSLTPVVRVARRRDSEPLEVRRYVNGVLTKVKVVTEYETTVWSHVLGIFEDGRWSLVSLMDADAYEALIEVYPAFRKPRLPRTRSQMQASSVILE